MTIETFIFTYFPTVCFGITFFLCSISYHRLTGMSREAKWRWIGPYSLGFGLMFLASLGNAISDAIMRWGSIEQAYAPFRVTRTFFLLGENIIAYGTVLLWLTIKSIPTREAGRQAMHEDAVSFQEGTWPPPPSQRQ